jgi:uncharacterized LabA/DUF88 family protein
MAAAETLSMALFCDFENVALGVRDANYEKFDIKPVLERLLLKGSIVVKKAYCDWDRYKGFKAPMHEANFELIEIPHVRQSGKNSADIRLVVDALDLCYTKAHVNTFVIISGDSDFSPLVSKLRENAKQVIGVGVKQSTSDLLIANCDEFIFYDDLVRESQRSRGSRRRDNQSARRGDDEQRHDHRREQAVEIAVETFEALMAERGDSGKIWASVLKEAIKRRKPDFSESYYGFRTFGALLEEAQKRQLLEVGRDEKSGTYVYRSSSEQAGPESGAGDGDKAASVVGQQPERPAATGAAADAAEATEAAEAKPATRKRGRGRRSAEPAATDGSATVSATPPAAPNQEMPQSGGGPVAAAAVPAPLPERMPAASPAAPAADITPAAADPAEAQPAPKKRATRARRPRKSSAGEAEASGDAEKNPAVTD